MRIFKTVSGTEFQYGSRIPWYLGRCHYDINTDTIILAPVPLNWIIGWSYEAWMRIRFGPEGMMRRLDTARSIGFKEGLASGKEQALRAYEQATKYGK